MFGNGTSAIGATAVKFRDSGGSASDLLLEQAGPLGYLLLDASVGVAATGVSSQDGVYHDMHNYTTSRLHIVRNLNFPVNAGNLSSTGTTTPASIYFAGIATATKTYTATGLVFEFIFEY